MKKRFLKVTALVLAFVLMLGNVAFATSGDVDPEIIAETKETAIQIESEGIVLLKNEDNFLPLSNKKVNVFGAGSVCPFFGGAGSGAITTDDPVTLYEAFEAEGIEYNAELRSLYEKHCLSNELPKTDNTVINNLLQVLQHKAAVKLAYAKDPVGFGNALREACKNLCIMKMETKAFKNPEITYDSSLVGTLDTFDDWNFEFPYIFTFIRFVFNNVLNVIIYAFRFIL